MMMKLIIKPSLSPDYGYFSVRRAIVSNSTGFFKETVSETLQISHQLT